MTDHAAKLLGRVQNHIRRAQRNVLRGAVGKYVRRAGVTYLVVSVNKKHVIVSDVKTPVKQTIQISKDAFLAKKIVVLEEQ